MQFSIRELLIAVAGFACILGTFSMYGTWGASVLGFAGGVILVVRGRRSARSGILCTGVVLSIGSSCVLSVMLAGWLVFGIGPIYSRAAWPFELKRMVEIGSIDSGDAKVECLGSFIDAEYPGRLIAIRSAARSCSADRLR